MIDHKNGDTIDNRRANLRAATVADNARNTGLRSDNSSGFKGVIWHSQIGRWRAQLIMHGKKVSLGCYSSADDAARAWDEGARRYHGEFARLNFPRPGERGLKGEAASGGVP